MSTYGTLKTRITNELQRGDLTAEASKAASTALDFYKRQRFNFNSVRATAATADGQEFYQLPTDYVEADTMILIDGSELVYLTERSHRWVDQNKEWQSYESRPTTFSVQNKELRLYPVPDQSYTLRLSYVYKLYEVSSGAADADTNAWFTEGEELLRLHAKVDMLENVIRGPESFQEAEYLRRRESEVLKQLRREYKRAHSSGRLTPWA